jgi:type II secretory pathway predicted ATPase ExeA
VIYEAVTGAEMPMRVRGRIRTCDNARNELVELCRTTAVAALIIEEAEDLSGERLYVLRGLISVAEAP